METLKDEMTELFLTFLPGQVGSRFSRLIVLKQERWRNIDPWRTWTYVDSHSVLEWKGSIDDLLTSPPASNHASAKVTVLRCGHDAPSLERLTLRDALIGEAAIFEGSERQSYGLPRGSSIVGCDWPPLTMAVVG